MRHFTRRVGSRWALSKAQLEDYLRSTEFINWQHPVVQSRARELAQTAVSEVGIAKACFEWVRDGIKHSHDFGIQAVTCKASDVLVEKTGYCYAKSHLLAALLRANKIPAGLCYQRLTLDDDGTQFCLHGLNAIFLADYGWYRVDPRGNKPGVNAQFTPPVEQLAFSIQMAGEADLPEIWIDPLPTVVDVLQAYKTSNEVGQNLPDIQLVSI